MNRRVYNLLKSLSEHDYIVEQGLDENTGFYYKKWASGFAECWTTWEETVIHHTETTEDYMKYIYRNTFTLPFAFIRFSPTVSVAVGNARAEILRVTKPTASTVYCLWASNQLDALSTLHISVQGLWKALESRGGGSN